ncbi:PhzF family phenazine biosynthesis protein [Nodosilinea sp. PGN35]|uniref:PhzF family phenazine biosynthesis protein n=1 Tax=Nodosilinea sp. PGN35 TaxID=3020489 RepID=UPI0023B334A2|nr:PhzF family phenazine biosynthesis protein [Nodosilinea sp. TSF1-S3]MDF0368928.1 PhzF family phenazine biosynthesis protein [Nodosilinea sp. TSF1-S3]
MAIPLVQVDAFTDLAYGGNPAAVCALPEARPDRWMQQVAQEMNLSETAFFYPEAEGYRLRWFTPTVEVDLCGHATLATSHVLWSEGHLGSEQPATFYTRSGVLTARRQGDWIELNFPANPSHPIGAPAGLAEALGAAPTAIAENSLGYLVELESAAVVRDLRPDFAALRRFPVHGVIVTSRGDAPYDFVSRFFAPAIGIDEDPVTGAAHCCLGPYWREKLGKTTFLAHQSSARGGVVKVQDEGDLGSEGLARRVRLSGQAVTVLRGELLH